MSADPVDILTVALAELVRLKDGPRDERYQEAKDDAWVQARAALALLPTNPAADLPVPTRATVLTSLVHENFCRWPDHRDCCNVTVEDCTCNVALNIRALELCGWLQLEPGPPLYPGTRFLILCTLDGRRRGEVTVGESRLPVAPVLVTIRAVGTAEAQTMWPQLTTDELAVLQRLVTDIDTDAAEREEDDG